MAVAFCREMRKGNSGNDVRGHKRALSRWNDEVYPWVTLEDGGFTRYFGGKFEQAVETFQRRNGLPTTGRINKATHDRLASKKNPDGDPVFDQLAITLCSDFCQDYGELKVRNDVISSGWFWYEHRSTIAYTQHRPFPMCKPPRVPPGWDCSAFVTNCYYAGGARDPNNRGFDGLGYTGTLCANGTRVGLSEAKIGDLVFYGHTTRSSPAFPVGSPTHVAIYVGTVKNIHSVLSHGSYPMKLLPVTYRPVNQIRSYM